MIWLWPKRRPGQSQFCYFYQLRYPELRGGIYLKECVNERSR